jgi:GNAT superfamily N-acetyltransferase
VVHFRTTSHVRHNSSVEVQILQDPSIFSDCSRQWMASEPFSSNVIGVYLDGILNGSRPRGDGDIWVAVLDQGQVIGVAMHTPPFPVFLPRLLAGVATDIAVALHQTGREVRGVNGEKRSVAEFVDAWVKQSRTTSELRRASRMYRLGILRPPPDVRGQPQRAEPDKRDLVVEWFVAFQAETKAEEGFDAMVLAERRLAAGDLWLWIDGENPVSLAGYSQPAAGVARIGPVYTPPGCRRHGYASAVTARASQAALDAGADHVVLYTDLANPTSNAIYQDLGYLPEHDAEERSFKMVR